MYTRPTSWLWQKYDNDGIAFCGVVADTVRTHTHTHIHGEKVNMRFLLLRKLSLSFCTYLSLLCRRITLLAASAVFT